SPAAVAASSSWRTCPITVRCEVDRLAPLVGPGSGSGGVADGAGDGSRWVVTVPVAPVSDHGRLTHVSQTVRTAGDRSPLPGRSPDSDQPERPGRTHGHQPVHWQSTKAEGSRHCLVSSRGPLRGPLWWEGNHRLSRHCATPSPHSVQLAAISDQSCLV